MTIHFDALKPLYPKAELQGLSEYYKGKARIAFISHEKPDGDIRCRELQTQRHILIAIANGATRFVLAVKDVDGTIYHPDFNVSELIY